MTRTAPKTSDRQLRSICTAWRKGMLDKRSSRAECAKLSMALQGYLSFACGLDTTLYESVVGEWNHVYLRLADGRVIDCAGDQFGPQYPAVYIGEPLDIHAGGVQWPSEGGQHERQAG